MKMQIPGKPYSETRGCGAAEIRLTSRQGMTILCRASRRVPNSVYQALCQESRYRLRIETAGWIEHDTADFQPTLFAIYDRPLRAALTRALRHHVANVKHLAVVGPGHNLSELLFLAQLFPNATITGIEPQTEVVTWLQAKARKITAPELAPILRRIELLPVADNTVTDDPRYRCKFDLVYFAGLLTILGLPPADAQTYREELATHTNLLLRSGGHYAWLGSSTEWKQTLRDFGLNEHARLPMPSSNLTCDLVVFKKSREIELTDDRTPQNLTPIPLLA